VLGYGLCLSTIHIVSEQLTYGVVVCVTADPKARSVQYNLPYKDMSAPVVGEQQGQQQSQHQLQQQQQQMQT
jgi:hypothetical protein